MTEVWISAQTKDQILLSQRYKKASENTDSYQENFNSNKLKHTHREKADNLYGSSKLKGKGQLSLQVNARFSTRERSWKMNGQNSENKTSGRD